MKWLKRLILWLMLLIVVVFSAYLNHLHGVVKDEFSKPLDAKNSTLLLAQQPRALINMLLIVEDQSFFQHNGVDFREITRVVRDYYLHDKPMRGASTITQQLIKNSLLTRKKTLTRKLNEALMALLLEATFDKEMILNRYMNSVYLGQHGYYEVHGFQRAAQFYFNAKLEDLPLKHLATLVALIKGPSYYHPTKHPRRLLRRRNLVLQLYYKYKKTIKWHNAKYTKYTKYAKHTGN
ncbi:biosynthetic peptidoglycan transglycosylase [Bathymodiolus thermophilus thioautotrophic gill symbiont]|uniref:biosynthetic peptidoglycan transglycosylase n=1 Tax=Bathymodiolus thermophilus thioautotrophic gill symbiont TaxID=2360 RepID=UPI00214CADA8|nr:biosynthetic peptidoglycan transglycosylase [Bathymodiolus thermophilus thioautotrophic gill symbiont]